MSPLTDRDQRRSQWGADHHEDPMPASPRPAGEATLALGRAAVVLTVGIWVALMISVLTSQIGGPSENHASALQTIVFLVVVTLLAASATAYLVARLGFYYRTREHQRVPRAMLDEFYAARAPALTVLVPSYQEEPDVIRMTLLSAALQEYPNKRVVLLIDDPPDPPYAQPYRLLSAARALPGQIAALLAEPSDRFDGALSEYEARHDPYAGVTAAELAELAGHYDHAAQWVWRVALGHRGIDHNERFFGAHVLGQLVADLGLTAGAIRSAAADDPAKLPRSRVTHLYRRLAWTFRAEVDSFERKRYLSLSHEPNKAMNLNSYIGLMGGCYRDRPTPAGRMLAMAGLDDANLVVPDADYVLTLDADSVLLPEYAL
jgi:hypothetical protein